MLFRLSLLILTVITKLTTAEETVTLAPGLAMMIYNDTLSLFNEDDIKCFNWYWEQKDVLEAQERDRLGCPVTTCTREKQQARNCCATHVFIHRMRYELVPQPDDHVCYKTHWLNPLPPIEKVNLGLKEFAKMNKEPCMPKYLPYSDDCMEVADFLGLDIPWWTEEPPRVTTPTLEPIIDDYDGNNSNGSQRDNTTTDNNSHNSLHQYLTKTIIISILI